MAQRTPFAWPKRALPHKARLTENLQLKCCKRCLSKALGECESGQVERSFRGGGKKKKKKSQLSLITNPAGFWKSKLHHALPPSAHTYAQKYAPSEAGSSPSLLGAGWQRPSGSVIKQSMLEPTRVSLHEDVRGTLIPRISDNSWDPSNSVYCLRQPLFLM